MIEGAQSRATVCQAVGRLAGGERDEASSARGRGDPWGPRRTGAQAGPQGHSSQRLRTREKADPSVPRHADASFLCESF